MNKSLFYLYKYIHAHRLREDDGVLNIQTRSGTIVIPLRFAIYDADIDLVPHHDKRLTAPCDIPCKEFVNVEIHAWGRRCKFEDYDPDADGSPFSAEPHSLIITWNVDSFKTLRWRASGFR